MLIDHLNLSLNIAIFLGGGFIFFWFVIHSRRWETAFQAKKIDEHEHRIDMLMTLFERLEKGHHSLLAGSSEMDAKIWEQLKRITDRLDRMQCPMHNLECPLNELVGPEIWTSEQRDAYRKKREEEEEKGKDGT